jgi:DNA-binding NarL/FixJ family response regulator
MKPKRTAEAIRVLLVDDHKTVLWGLEKLVESAYPRMEVAGVANTVEEMFDVLEQADPHVVLLDLDLSGRSACEVLPELSQRTSAHTLLLTAERSGTVLEAAIMRGARGVVGKDEAPEVLLRAIERVNAGEVWVNRRMMGRVLGALAAPQRPRDPEADKIASLTTREREIIASVVRQRGAKGVAIAEELHISENTLRNHLTVIYSKLGLRNRIELFVYAGEHGLTDNRALSA